ncbi:MAG: carbohydrate kinase family protein [Candidatus Woesearchaeota archaeon]
MKPEVITFGSATVDIFAETSKQDVVHLCTDKGCEDLLVYHPGDKVLLSDLHTSIGGGGTNTAACFAKQGVSVAFAGSVGQDAHGDRVLDWLRENNIAFVGARVKETTNTSIILDSKQLQDRTILTYKAASDALREEALDFSALHATWWYSSSLVGRSFQTLLALMRYARKHGIAFAFNPSSYQTQTGLVGLGECVSLSTFFVCNKEEAEMLVGSGNRADLCRRLRGAGAEIVCVTEAEHGASLLYADKVYHVGSAASEVVETTGAGDCFASTVVASLILGFSPRDALVRAALHSEELIRYVGAKEGLLSREELDKRLAQDTREVVVERA